jgi:hypothetical protein
MERLNPLDFEEINIVPMDDIDEHIDGLECWCCPTWDAKNQWNLLAKVDCRMMVVHRKVRDELQ